MPALWGHLETSLGRDGERMPEIQLPFELISDDFLWLVPWRQADSVLSGCDSPDTHPVGAFLFSFKVSFTELYFS